MKINMFVCQKSLGKFQLVITLALFFCVATVDIATAQTSQIIYVRKGAPAPGNGTSWATAYPDLQQALAAASSLGGTKEIWVAQGEYKPTSTLDRTVSFILPSNTILYGGFVGNETSPVNRAWRINRTVLSGDLGVQFDNLDNSAHVVLVNGIENSEINGFIIKDGHAADSEEAHGGGLYLIGTNESHHFKINNCEFTGNTAILGGALTARDAYQAEITNCYFTGNHASVGGGAFITGGLSSGITFTNCVFSSNSTDFIGGACANTRNASFINCTMTNNRCDGEGTALYNSGILHVYNSVIWKNYQTGFDPPNYLIPILNSVDGVLEVKNNIIQGGFGTAEDNNIDADPLFENEATVAGIYPRTSIISVSTTDAKYENVLQINGPLMGGPWPYHAYKDHTYNKIYLPGRNLQVLDFSNLTDGKPASTIYSEVNYGTTQRPDKSIHTAGNKIYFASYYSGIVSVDRATGQVSSYDALAGEGLTYNYVKARDLVVDDANNLLYCPVFYDPGNVFYGVLELNLTTQAKRWITTTSSPVAISSVLPLDFDQYWGGFRMYLDDVENVFYLSTGTGVWWWNRTTNATGVISTSGGLPLVPGNPSLPSNFTTGMFMDHTENKFYIGTHEGLFVWNRNNNTSRVYNTSNSLLAHNLINTIDKNEERDLIYVACEEGGLFVINTQTGVEKLITEDSGSEVYPQYMDASAASAYYDEVDKKLYVSADHPSGGVWIQDYNNLIPDYGDLRIKAGSPAIDKGNATFYPSSLTTDIAGLNRFANFPSIEGDNSLDIGAHERPYNPEEEEPNPPLEISDQNYILTFSPTVETTDENSLEDAPVRQVNKNITYFDGLGRPVQSIAIQSSRQRNDVVAPIIYDEFGREPLKYLPYATGNNGAYRTSPIADVTSFYAQGDDKIENDSRPFSETVFEPSPLNRPLKDYGPGSDWKTNEKFVQHGYLSNVAAVENVIAWMVDENGLPAKEPDVQDYIVNGHYASNQLYIKVTIDEHGHAVREYTNKQGQVILKKIQAVAGSTNLNNIDEWACTYYIYDDLGNLRYVLSPEGVKHLLLLDN